MHSSSLPLLAVIHFSSFGPNSFCSTLYFQLSRPNMLLDQSTRKAVLLIYLPFHPIFLPFFHKYFFSSYISLLTLRHMMQSAVALGLDIFHQNKMTIFVTLRNDKFSSDPLFKHQPQVCVIIPSPTMSLVKNFLRLTEVSCYHNVQTDPSRFL